MGQKINPTGFRLPVTRNWTSRWYAVGRNFSRTLGEDLRVRAFLEKKLKAASPHHDLLGSSRRRDRQAGCGYRSSEG